MLAVHELALAAALNGTRMTILKMPYDQQQLLVQVTRLDFLLHALVLRFDVRVHIFSSDGCSPGNHHIIPAMCRKAWTLENLPEIPEGLLDGGVSQANGQKEWRHP